MSKPKKETKPRPEQYAQKVAINVGFNEVLQIFSNAAHDKAKAKQDPIHITKKGR